MNTDSRTEVVAEFKRLTDAFFAAVSFLPGSKPSYEDIHELFIDAGLLIKNVGPAPEINTVAEFVRPRRASVEAGQLTRFHEAEITDVSEVFGNVGHRFSSYVKSGSLNGTSFDARGMVCTQFIKTPSGWRISSMTWDDERPGLKLPAEFEPSEK